VTAQDPVEILSLLRDRIVDQAQRIPNHTCVETVERDRYQRVAEQVRQSCDSILARRKQPNVVKLSHLESSDRIRLDVLVSRDREVYSWPGAARFEEGDIDQLVHQGAMGTGGFATLLQSVFETRSERFTFLGRTLLAGRTVYEYSFHILRQDSQYRYKDMTQPWTPTGYAGSLFVDPHTAALVRFTVRTDELPPSSDSCEVDTTLDYEDVQLSGSGYMVPLATRQRFIGRDGTESENSYEFSACRDYQGESQLKFGAAQPAGDADVRPHPKPARVLSAGLALSIDLTTSLDSDTAAAGDRIEGRVAKPILNLDHATSVPAGARVLGRLMRVEVEHLPTRRVTFVLEWETLEVDGASEPLVLVPNRKVKQPGIQFGGLASVPALMAALRKRGTVIELPRPDEERFAIFHFPGERHIMEPGTRTEWLTTTQ